MEAKQKSWLDYFLPANTTLSLDDIKRLRVFISICFITSLFMSITTLLRLYSNISYGKTNYIGPLIILSTFICPFLIKYTKKATLIIYAAFLISMSAVIHRCFYDSFLYSAAILWVLPLPSLALVILERNKSIPITVLAFFTVALIGFLHAKTIGFLPRDPQLFATYFFVMSFITITSYLFEREKSNSYEAYLNLQKENHKKERFTMLGEMVSGLAHEINNPLTIIMASSNLINKELKNTHQNERTSEKLKTLNHKIESHSSRINNLIVSLREYSKNENEINKDILNLNDFIKSLAKDRAEQFLKYQIEFRIKTSAEEIWINANEAILRQAFQNLIANSFDAVHLLPERWIEIEMNLKKEYLEFTITDSGNGIAEEYHEKLMSAFFTTKDIGKGMGIGLLLSARYFEFHQAELSYNKFAHNTQFKIKMKAKIQSSHFASDRIREYAQYFKKIA